MSNKNVIQLRHFSENDADVLNTFELPKDQERFTSLPVNFAEVSVGEYRTVILNDHEPVGFFILHSTARVKEYTENPNAMLLTSLSINYVKQGKGYAKQAMLALAEFVSSEYPACNEIVLAVNHKNIAAQQLYRKVGFQDTGKRKIGPIGEQLILSLRL